MKVVKCKKCKREIGHSDGAAFFRDGRAVNELDCVCGAIRKLYGARRRPEPMIFHDLNFSVHLSG
jgi:hypothetical protein